MGDFASSLKKVEKKTSAKDKVTGFFLNRKDECLQKEVAEELQFLLRMLCLKESRQPPKKEGFQKMLLS